MTTVSTFTCSRISPCCCSIGACPPRDVIAIRHMMYLSLSYDHRIVDGSLGASFLTAVANELEAFDGDSG